METVGGGAVLGLGVEPFSQHLQYSQAPGLRPDHATVEANGAQKPSRISIALGNEVFVIHMATRGMKKILDIMSMLLHHIKHRAVLRSLFRGTVQIVVGDHYMYRILRSILELKCNALNDLAVKSEPELLKGIHATLLDLATEFDITVPPEVSAPRWLLFTVTRQVLSWQGLQVVFVCLVRVFLC